MAWIFGFNQIFSRALFCIFCLFAISWMIGIGIFTYFWWSLMRIIPCTMSQGYWREFRIFWEDGTFQHISRWHSNAYRWEVVYHCPYIRIHNRNLIMGIFISPNWLLFRLPYRIVLPNYSVLYLFSLFYCFCHLFIVFAIFIVDSLLFLLWRVLVY